MRASVWTAWGVVIVSMMSGSSHASEPQSGSIEGTVTVNRKIAAAPMRFNAYPDAADPRARRSHEPARVDERQNVVIYLANVASRQAPPPSAPAVIRQEDETFLPHVLPIVKGATVEFVNEDPLYHNVFSLSRAATFDLGRLPRGSSKSVRFDRSGLVKVFCHIHSDMSASILVLDNPYFVVPDAQGHYRLDGVPPGEYTAVAWHERANPVSKVIRIAAGQTATVDFSVPVTEENP